MTIANQNLRLYRGDSHVVHVTVTQADGTPYDTSVPGVTMKYRMTRFPFDDSMSSVQKSLGSGIEEATGGVDITLEPADTDLPLGLYYHELKVWNGDDVATAMTGFVVIRRSAQMGDTVEPAQANLAASADAPTVS